MPHSIALVMPYFGRVPPHFHFFVDSARRNPGITIFWLTDQHYAEPLPSNIVVTRTSLDKIRAKISTVCELDVSLEYPYKICDFRPAYGFVFSDIVSSFDYWGWADFDVLWGDLQSAVHDQIAKGHDVITFHNLWLSGAFSLLRNSSIINLCFKRHHNWKTVFTQSNHFSFGECDRHWEQHMRFGDLSRVNLSPPSLTQIVYEMGKRGEISCSFLPRIKEWLDSDEILHFDRRLNKLTSINSGQEFPLFHWVRKSHAFRFLRATQMSGDIYVSREGFWSARDEITTTSRGLRQLRGQFKRLTASKRLPFRYFHAELDDAKYKSE